MKQIKKHFKRLHKIQVHKNRWFIWMIVISAVSFLLLLYYIKYTTRLIEQDFVDSPLMVSQGVQYKDTYLGFSIRHPMNWGVEFQERNIIEFNNPYNYGEGFTVAVYDLKDLATIKKSLSIAKEEQVTVVNEPSIMLTLTPSTKDSATNAVLIPHEDKLYVIKGNNAGFIGSVSTFKLTPIAKSN